MFRIVVLLLLCIAWLTTPETAVCQESTEANQESPDSPVALFGGLLGESMRDQISQVAIGMIDRYLDFLAKPQTTVKLATFQKNYYDALVAQGFTRDQAFELLLRFGNPLAGGPQAGP